MSIKDYGEQHIKGNFYKDFLVEALKGSVVGSFTSGLGLVGTVAGKKSRVPLADKGLEFAGEIFGLGTVSPLLDPNEKFDFGADLLQLYTGLVYKGPNVLREILKV